MDKLIFQPLSKSDISTVIVVDALDECKDDEPASTILSALEKFMTKIPRVKFLVTGRPDPRIRIGLQLPLLAEATGVFVLHMVESPQVNSDLRLFFRQKFLEIKGRQCGLDGWPTEEQLKLLCERAAGLFIYAMATVRFIDQNKNPKKQLARLLQSSESTIEGATKLKGSTTIDSLYRSILQESFGNDDPEEDLNIRSVLGAVVLAVNPLSPSTVAALLGFDLDDVSPLLSSVHSLLIFEEGVDHPVRPFHKSFPDFIIDPTRCTNPRFRVCPSDQHAKILVGCLELMNRTLKQNMCQLPDGVANSEVDDLKERTEQYINKALEYACRSWHKHLIGNMPTRTLEILHQFLTEKFLFWLEVLSVLGASRDAADALEATAKWLDVSPILDIARDCSRFIITFFDLISTSAQHIYTSALPLSPRTSTVLGMYKQYQRPSVTIVHGLPTSWEPVVATVYDEGFRGAVWSPCNRFIAIDKGLAVEIRDAATLALLNTFECPRSPFFSLAFSQDCRFLTRFTFGHCTRWDLKTGGSVGVGIDLTKGPYLAHWHSSSVYSIDGKTAAVASFGGRDKTHIITCDVSAALTHLHPISEGLVIPPIWTCGEFLRFASVESGRITIREVDFALTHPPKAVESFSTPEEITNTEAFKKYLFLPTLSRLAIAFHGTLLIWDARGSKLLLKSSSPDLIESSSPDMSFSSNGLFFACLLRKTGEVCVWKESLSVYTLHQRLTFSPFASYPGPFLSPDGASVVVCLGYTIRLWHTKDPIRSWGRPISAINPYQNSVLVFPPGEILAAFARGLGSTVTILDLQSGDKKMVIDSSMEVRCLGVTGSTVVVVGDERIVTWNVVGGNARADIKDSVRIVTFDLSLAPSPFGQPPFTRMSVSPDLSRIVTSGRGTGPQSAGIEIRDVSTGRCLAGIATGTVVLKSLSALYGFEVADTSEDQYEMSPWFAPDGREIWGVGYSDSVDRWEIVEDDESGTTKLQPLGSTTSPPGVLPWQSSHGYEAMDDGWILSPTKKRLLWLPHEWRLSYRGSRTWSGRFLGLGHYSLPEVVILEFID